MGACGDRMNHDKTMNKHLRQTGRTTRMLKHALQLSEQRRAVYVIADNERQADMMRRQLGDGPHGIKVETLASLGNYDLITGDLRGAHPNCVVLVDHYVIERRFGRLWEQMHAYDSEAAVGGGCENDESPLRPQQEGLRYE